MMLSMALRTQLSRRPVLYLPLLFCFVVCSGYGQSTAAADPGRVALERGDYSAAEAAYRNALRENPRSPELLTDLGISLQLQGRSTEAIHAFEQALNVKSLPRTYALLAEEKCKTRDLDGARPMVAKILAEDPLDCAASPSLRRAISNSMNLSKLFRPTAPCSPIRDFLATWP